MVIDTFLSAISIIFLLSLKWAVESKVLFDKYLKISSFAGIEIPNDDAK